MRILRIPRLELLYLGFNGRGTTGLVQRKGEKESPVRAISPNTEVGENIGFVRYEAVRR